MLANAARIAYPHEQAHCPLAGKRAIDVGCHEGFYTHRLLSLGADSVVGVDVRATNIAKAQLVSDALETKHVSWLVGDAEELAETIGDGVQHFEFALVFGLLYHCENPIRVLRQIASVTKEVIIVETQLCDELGADRIEWGRQGYSLDVRGAFAVVDETALHPTNNETGVHPLALCPSPRALQVVLEHCGFTDFSRVVPRGGQNEQLVRGKRGVFVARRSESGA